MVGTFTPNYKDRMSDPTPKDQVRFGRRFWDQHAGSVLADPAVAIVEIVANAWDAGADTVEIEWPTVAGEALRIKDNGTGLTREEFIRRWNELHYDRREEQGDDVVRSTALR